MNQYMVNLFFARSESLSRQAQAVHQMVDQGMTLVFKQMGVWLQANINKTFAVVDQEFVIPDPALDKGREMAYRLGLGHAFDEGDRKSTRLNSSHSSISYAVFCL